MSFNCAYCSASFPCQNYANSIIRAEQARDAHQISTHPSKLHCGQCGQFLTVNYNIENGQKISEMFMAKHQQTCPGFQCKFCGEEFKGLLFRGGYVIAERERNKHQQTHPKVICCDHCGKDFLINYNEPDGFLLAQQNKTVHEKQCGGLPCVHCTTCFSMQFFGGSRERAAKARDSHQFTHSVDGTALSRGVPRVGDEHALLLAVAKVDASRFSLVAWHCSTKKLFRPISTSAFWSVAEFNETKLVEGNLFRFQRHPNQFFAAEDWDPQGPHVCDNIRVYDVSPLEGPWPQLYRKIGSIQELLHLDESLVKASPPMLTAQQAAKADFYYSSFVLVSITKLKFNLQDQHDDYRMRCSFMDPDTKQRYRDVPVINANLCSRAMYPVASPGKQLAILGLSNRRGAPELMFIAWIDDILSAKMCSDKAKADSKENVSGSISSISSISSGTGSGSTDV